MDAYKDEIFGPVLGVTRVGTYNEAVKLVNENPYGNGTAIFTRDGGVARQLRFDGQAGGAGTVGLHPRRRRGAQVPVRRAGGDGRDQRADPRPGRVLLVRRVEELPL